MNPLKQVFNNSKDKWDFIIALIVILLFTITAFRLLSNANEVSLKEATALDSENKSDIKSSEIKLDTVSKSNISYSHKKTTKYRTQTIKAENAYEKTVDSAIVVSDMVRNSLVETSPIVGATKDLEIIEEEPAKSFDSIPPTESPSTKTEITETLEESVTETVAIEETPQNTEELEENEIAAVKNIENTIEKTVTSDNTITKTNSNFDCMAIVGVFRRTSNKNTIINKLISLGYTNPQSVLKQGLNYVGVPIDCNSKKEKQQLIKKLNETFDIASWVMKI